MSMRNPFGGDAAAGKGFAALGGLAKGLGAKRGKSRSTHFNEAVEVHKQRTAIDTVAAMQLREHESNMNIKEAKAASKEGRKSRAPVQYESNYAKMAVGKPEPKAPKQSEGVSPTPSEKMAASDTSPKPIKAPAEKPKPTGSVFELEGAKEKGFQSTNTQTPDPRRKTMKDYESAEASELQKRKDNMKSTPNSPKAPKSTAKKPNSAPTTKTSKAGPNTNKPSAGTPKAKTQVRNAAMARNKAKGNK